MIRFTKKWWLVRQLYKECCEHCKKETYEFFYANNRYWIGRSDFLKQISAQCVYRIPRFLGSKEDKEKPEKMKKKMNEYNSIIDSCIKGEKNWVREDKRKIDGKLFITTTTEGEDIMGYSDLIQKLLSKYNFLWGIIWAILAFFAGIFTDNLINIINKL